MTAVPWVVGGYLTALAVALAFNRGAHRKPSPRPPAMPNSVSGAEGRGEFVPLRMILDPGTDTTGCLVIEDTLEVGNDDGADTTGPVLSP